MKSVLVLITFIIDFYQKISNLYSKKLKSYHFTFFIFSYWNLKSLANFQTEILPHSQILRKIKRLILLLRYFQNLVEVNLLHHCLSLNQIPSLWIQACYPHHSLVQTHQSLILPSFNYQIIFPKLVWY